MTMEEEIQVERFRNETLEEAPFKPGEFVRCISVGKCGKRGDLHFERNGVYQVVDYGIRGMTRILGESGQELWVLAKLFVGVKPIEE